jgi:hypothetical protein
LTGLLGLLTFLFIREPGPFATPLLPTDLAERMLWGRAV